MTLKALITATALGSAAMVAGPASAMPVDNLADAAASNVEQVRWVCGPYRCWWRPGPYFYGPRFYGYNRPYYYRRHFFHRRFYY
jgi:hypothetical protein